MRARSTVRSFGSDCCSSSGSPWPRMRQASAFPEAAPLPRPAVSSHETSAVAARPSLFTIGLSTLVVASVITRLPFMTQTLYAFDSANYALGVRDFYNVAFHQPHPPGYPLYVFFARAIDVPVHDANRALILEGL